MADENFARDYLAGVAGLTTDEAWAFSDLIIELSSKDLTAASIDDLERPVGKTQAGEEIKLKNAKAVTLEDYEDGRKLMIWQYETNMTLKGKNYGKYYIYSNPFAWTVKKKTENKGSWEKTKEGWKYQNGDGTYAKSEWKAVGGKWYYFDSNALMEKDAYREGFYLTKTGVWDEKKAVIGWKHNRSGWWYSLDGKTWLANTWKKIDGKWYYFKKNGYAAANEFVKGWWYGVSGGWYARNASYVIDGKSYTFNAKGYCTNP